MSLKARAVRFDLGNRTIRESNLDDLQIDFGDRNAIYWVHLDATDPDLLAEAGKRLKVSDDVLKEISEVESLSSVLETEDSLTLFVPFWVPSRDGEAKDPVRLVIHLTERYCLTVATQRIPALEKFALTYFREFRFAQTPGFILFLVLDYLIDDYTRALRILDDRAEAIDDRIRVDFHENVNREVLDLKGDIIRAKRFAVGIRDVLMRISGRKIAVISDAGRQSLSEVYQHSQVVVNELEALRDLVIGFLDAYNAALAQKLNETMKVLTLFSAIILPMSLVAGIYGMNFEGMPELKWKYGYAFALALMLSCATGLFLYFRKKRWF